jgi:hypothetical protein
MASADRWGALFPRLPKAVLIHFVLPHLTAGELVQCMLTCRLPTTWIGSLPLWKQLCTAPNAPFHLSHPCVQWTAQDEKDQSAGRWRAVYGRSASLRSFLQGFVTPVTPQLEEAVYKYANLTKIALVGATRTGKSRMMHMYVRLLRCSSTLPFDRPVML